MLYLPQRLQRLHSRWSCGLSASAAVRCAKSARRKKTRATWKCRREGGQVRFALDSERNDFARSHLCILCTDVTLCRSTIDQSSMIDKWQRNARWQLVSMPFLQTLGRSMKMFIRTMVVTSSSYLGAEDTESECYSVLAASPPLSLIKLLAWD